MRNVVIAALCLVLLIGAGWSTLPQPPADLVHLTGCSWVQAEQLSVGDKSVVDVRAAGCDRDGGPDSSAMTTHIAGTTWSSLQHPVDAIHVRLVDGIAAAEPTVYTAAELADRYELGSAPRPSRPFAAGLWLLVPLAYIVTFGLTCTFAARVRRTGALILLVRP